VNTLTRSRGGRNEKRIPNAMRVQLTAQSQPPLYELTVTENVSSQGARVQTRHSWNPGDYVVFQAVLQEFQSRAQVIYCERLSSEKYAVGLHFSSPSANDHSSKGSVGKTQTPLKNCHL